MTRISELFPPFLTKLNVYCRHPNAEVITHGSKEESKGYEEEGLRKQEDKSQEKEEVKLFSGRPAIGVF